MDIKTIIKIISEKENISYEEAEIEFDKIWNKPIDEDKLDELAKKECHKILNTNILYSENYYEIYKAGYRKAMKNNYGNI